LYEIDRIEFTGNSVFTNEELNSILSEKTTRRNTFHKVIEHYYFGFKEIENINKYLPPGTMSTLKQALKRWAPEIRFFEEAKAKADIETIKEFYNQNGFHDVDAYYTFLPDSNSRKNILTFHIEESDRYSIKNVLYEGLDSLTDDVSQKLRRIKKLRKGSAFNEDVIITEIRSIQQTLLNNGYYYSIFKTPVVSKDTVYKTDSLTIKFITGKRQKISHLMYIDSLAGQKIVTNSLKDKQLIFSAGDWYSRRKVEESRQNLQALGTFELVSIDTSSLVSAKTDTTLPIRIFTRYRKQQEWGFGLYINQDEFTNTGFEASYLNRNIGGIAQSLSVFARAEFQDISRLFDSELDIQFGANYAQPFLWKIGNARIGLAGQGLFSRSKIFLFSKNSKYLQLQTTSLQVKFPTQLPPWTYFNNMSFDFLIEWQTPLNFIKAKNNAINEAIRDGNDTNVVIETFKIYKTLNKFYGNHSSFEPTAFIFGFSMAGDSRDDLFNPTKGYFTNISIDAGFGFIGLGIANYVRPQISYNLFTSLNQYTVFAIKARGGKIWWWDQNNSYVPAERQFFAGGANSARGWESRRLRYLTGEILLTSEGASNNFAEDFIGSQVILEGTFEVRWRFGRPRWTSDLVADIINMGVMTTFIDWGNTFYWMAFNNKYYENFDYWNYLSLAVSAGMGLGIQTPVGPLRVDFSLPMYDPTPAKGLTHFVPNRNFALDYYQIHIGLGYAF
ncbi:BamA/TamA family outer membrane protein, partial [Bacteroidota bacterium]